MVTDPISDYLTRLRNAIAAKHKVVEIPGSNLKKAMTQILMDQGFILNFKFIEDSKQGIIKIALKYNNKTKDSAIKNLTRISKPGLRKYTDSKNLPRVINGLGIAIISTSKGVITDNELRIGWHAYKDLAKPARGRGASAGPIDFEGQYWSKRIPINSQKWMTNYLKPIGVEMKNEYDPMSLEDLMIC